VDVDQFDAVRRGDRIVSSNTYTLGTSIRAAGADVIELGIVPDDPEAYKERLGAARGCDLLIVGRRVGRRIRLRDVLKSLGAELQLWRVLMRPGAPLGFGMLATCRGSDCRESGVGHGDVRVVRAATHPDAARPGRCFRRTPRCAREDLSIAAPPAHFLRGSWLGTRMVRGPRSPVHRVLGCLRPWPRERAAFTAGSSRGAGRCCARYCSEHALTATCSTLSRADACAALEASLHRRFPVVETTMKIAGRSLSILHPASAEDLINEADFDRDERLPYWAELWPSSRTLAECMLATPGNGRSLLELGCGTGLVSTCASLSGFAVVVSDYYEDALRFAEVNSWRNDAPTPRGLLLDWRHLPADLERFDVVIASDVLYEQPYGALVARAIDASLADDGVAFVADPGRVARDNFMEAIDSLHLRVADCRDLAYEDGAIRAPSPSSRSAVAKRTPAVKSAPAVILIAGAQRSAPEGSLSRQGCCALTSRFLGTWIIENVS
jgi:predicted nicotinamide N-methyase